MQAHDALRHEFFGSVPVVLPNLQLEYPALQTTFGWHDKRPAKRMRWPWSGLANINQHWKGAGFAWMPSHFPRIRVQHCHAFAKRVHSKPRFFLPLAAAHPLG